MKIEFTDAEDERVLGLPEFRPPAAMSNFDQSIDPGLEDALRAGMKGRHAAQEFNGLVWLDGRTGLFCEAVRRYHEIVAVHAAATLEDLMREVNDEHGWA